MAPPPPPVPEIRSALVLVGEAGKAIHRATSAWNRYQLDDAIRSARYFLDEAEAEIKRGRPA